MKVILILVDALRSDYLTEENMPFLYKMKEMGMYIQEVNPGFGFCERTEILSGTVPAQSGNLMAIGYDPVESEYRKEKFVFSILSRLSFLDRYVRFLLSFLLKGKKALGLYKIPFGSIYNFVLTEDGKKNYGTESEDIIDILQNSNMSYDCSRFTSLSNKSNFGCNDKNQENADFIPIYIGMIDAMGHKHAHNIDEMKPYLNEVDREIKDIYEHYASIGGYRFMILGDHGMEPVQREVDIISGLRSINAKPGRDYELFVDSTSCRIWCRDPDLKQLIKKELNEKYSEFGKIIDDEMALKRHADLRILNSSGSRLYGDILWCANVGVLIHPDYFNGVKIHDKGMHGYYEVGTYSKGLAVILGKGISHNIVSECNLFDICPTLCDMLEIRYPHGNYGVSLLRMKEENT